MVSPVPLTLRRRNAAATRRWATYVQTVMMMLLLVLLAGTTGCELFQSKPDDKLVTPPPPPQRPVPTYAEIAQRYNTNSDAIKQLWARAVVSSQWVEADGDRRSEQGEGHFMFVKPSRVAISAGKFGQQLFWAGANESLFYVFNLSSDPKTVYYGRYMDFGGVLMSQIAMPVNPQDLLMMIGVEALPTAAALEQELFAGLKLEGHTEWYWGDVLVETPDGRWRLLVDPQTALALRVDMLDTQGTSVLSCTLSDHERINTPTGLGPRVATKIRIESAERQGDLTLSLSDMTDAKGTRRIRDRAFDFEALVRSLKPDEQVELKIE